MKRLTFALLLLVSVIVLIRAAPPPPLYPGVVPYEQLDTRNFELADYPVLRIMPFMARGAPPYLAVDTWSFAINTNNWFLYGFNPLNSTWNLVSSPLTINPTDGISPYRIDATTFGDSMLRYRASGSDLGQPTAGGGTSVYAGASGVFNFGIEAGQNGDFTGSLNVFNFGYRAGQNGIWDAVASSYNIGTEAGANTTMLPGANNIYNFGDLAGSSSIYKVSSESYNFGTYSGSSQRLTNSYAVYSLGAGAGQQLISTNSYSIYSLGEDAGRESSYKDSSEIYNLGWRANYQQVFDTKTNMFALGNGATTTNDNDFVFGDSRAHYAFPGEVSSQVFFITNIHAKGHTIIYNNLQGTNGGGWTFKPTGTGTADAGSSNVIASLPTGLRNATLINTADAFAAGEDAGFGTIMNQSTNIYNFGRDTGWGGEFTNAWSVMNVGDMAGAGMTVLDSRGVFNFGMEGGWNSWVTNGSLSSLNIGELAGEEQSLDFVWGVSNYGWRSGYVGHLTNTASAYNYGDVAGEAVTIADSLGIYNFGEDAGGSTTWNTVTNIHAFGASPLYGSSGTNLTSIYAFGTDALSLAGIINSTNVYAWGTGAGLSLSGDGYSDIYLFGSGAQPTRLTNEVSFGTVDDLYTFPGTMNAHVVNAINVKVPPYSAKGDGVTDDTAAIQAAVNAAPFSGLKSSVYFPAGAYKITGTITVSNEHLRIFGNGFYTVQILHVPTVTNSDCFYWPAPPTSYLQGNSVEGITVVGNSNTLSCFSINAQSDFGMKDVYPYGAKNGILENGCVNFNMSGVNRIGRCVTGITVATNSTTSSTYSGIYISSCGTGAKVDYGTVIFRSCIFESCTNYGLQIGSTRYGSAKVETCHFEANGSGAIQAGTDFADNIPSYIKSSGNYYIGKAGAYNMFTLDHCAFETAEDYVTTYTAIYSDTADTFITQLSAPQQVTGGPYTTGITTANSRGFLSPGVFTSQNVSVTGTNFVNELVVTNKLTTGQVISQSIQEQLGVLTHAGTTTLNFTPGANAMFMAATGQVDIAFSNLETNRYYHLIVANTQATNFNWTLPAVVFMGYYPTNLSAGKYGEWWFKVHPSTNSIVWAKYVEGQ